jgi:hypothetical protein
MGLDDSIVLILFRLIMMMYTFVDDESVYDFDAHTWSLVLALYERPL